MMISTERILEEPVFIVGAERSFSTLLTLMLTHHPDISWCPEFDYAVSCVGDEGEFPNLREYREQMSIDRVFQDDGYRYEIDTGSDYVSNIQGFLLQQQERTGKPIRGATVHHHFERLLWIFPNAKFVHLLRDPRDVARSCVSMGWAGNLWYGLDVWIEAEETWSELCAKVPPEKRLELIAEELVCDTRNQLERICRFIGTEYDSKMMDYVDDTTYSAPKPELTNQWKRKLSDREIRIIESRVGDMLVERGYELSGLPMKKIGPLEKSWLFYHHKVSKWKFRIRRYGFGLFVADIISRKIPISEEIRNAIRRRFHAIEYGTLK